MPMKLAILLVAVSASAVLAQASPSASPSPSTPASPSTPTSPSTPASPSTPLVATSPSTTALPVCDDPAVATRLSALLRAHRYADTHHAAVSLRVECGPRDGEPTWRLLDDIALLRLEDRAYAISDLEDLSHAHRPGADLVLAWAYLADRDTAAAKSALSRLPAPRAAALQALDTLDDEDAFATHAHALPASVSGRALELGHGYHAARAKSPAAAGILSALIPGAGQIYAGSFEAAAITFALNALFVGATVELALDKHYATAAAAGTAASFFYVGGIVNAVDLARRRNHVAQQPYADSLEQLLVPELSGDLAAP